ncbi:hypothetical protein [Mycobacterium sp. 1164966.3]|uniref:hypothetical protein n=1 Tax=Mycobacterium sp. 1164966.3 TaxID=1856861 RepID=UPI000A91258A|nr:hypothetical protein [Mycobacterium sp. 1164966.3]
MKYWKIDPVRAEIIVSMKIPAGVELGTHYHTGIVVAHTISGAWRYKESSWISRAGDTLYQVAGSSHTPESFEDTEVSSIWSVNCSSSTRTTRSSGRKSQDVHQSLHPVLRKQRHRGPRPH